jgi:hypothetical protein
MVKNFYAKFAGLVGFSSFREIGIAGAMLVKVAVTDMLIRTTAQFVDREKHD